MGGGPLTCPAMDPRDAQAEPPAPPPTSRLYTFIDQAREFAIFFLEAQRLIQELAVLQDIRGDGFAYFRDVVLSVQPMIALLKHGEQIGFYIDSRKPVFRLKIETACHGGTRCVLVPAGFREFPESMFGMVRVVKLFPRNRPPYESILEVVGQPLRAIINHVLRDSYQTTSAVLVSQHSDQSLMLHQLPPLPGEYDYSLDALRRRRTEIEGSVSDIFSQALVDRDEIVGAFAGIGFRFLAGREVRFECSCSRERMIRNILVTAGAEYAQFFDPGQEALDVTCEYCKSRYEITREALAQGVEKPN